MKHNRRRSTFLYTLLRLLLVLALLYVPGAGYAQEQTPNPEPPIDTPGPVSSFQVELESRLVGEVYNTTAPLQVYEQDDWGFAVINITGAYDLEVYLGKYNIDTGWVIISSKIVSAATFNSLLQEFPDTVMDEATKAFLAQTARPLGIAKFSSHKLPWTGGQTGYVTQKNGDGHYNQIDFDILGRGTNGDVFASKKGKVVFVKESSNSGWCDPNAWKRANIVVIEHSSNEYSWYVHLAPNSVPVSVGQEVDWGDKIGIEGNTGYSCGTHLHFLVSSGHTAWTDPNNPNDAPWATGIDAVDFNEVKWDDIRPGPYISQNKKDSGGSIPTPHRPPNRPSPSNPDDGHVARDGRAPTLCWNNNGDPDGDSVEFYAEVFESAKGANSGWRRDTCWRPGDLDGNYHTYKWRVKAKDSRGAESGWSDTRRFTIEAPNKPPTIDFQTANGNGDSRITTREQNWTFRGTANDPEGKFSRVEFKCTDCDNRGSGPDSTTSTNWTITRNGMSGRNLVYFQAFDDRQSTKSRTLELNIDLAPPTTEIQINGKSPNDWPQWFTEAAQVRLNGRDIGTGRAVADVREVRYRRDGGSEQVQSGKTANFTESGDGTYTVRFYSIDNVGNVESERSEPFRIDRTPPTGISGLQESDGVVSGQWQKDQNKPTFSWNASSDALSGLGGYQFYFGPDAGGEAVHFDVAAGSDLRLTPSNLGVATGTYYLRGRTWDKAGNTSTWQTLFTFRYDGTPPPNPGQATHADGPKNDTWQKITGQPNFTWPAPTDEGSGIKGYLVYWGDDENGESGNFITGNRYQTGTSLCTTGQACTGYLRLRSQDNVDWQAEEWSTTFVLRYDGARPVADFTVNNGVTQTAQTLLTLNINATDQGSGLREMRLSQDGNEWTAWETYATERVWEIPGISRQSWPVYLQVKDAVGWESDVVSRTIYFDVNVDRPRSENYWLFDWAKVAGAGAHTSQPTGYQGRSSVGQVLDSPRSASASYSLVGGYEAGSQAIPLVVPGHDEFEFINGIFASGVVNTTLKSGNYHLIGVAGELALPNNAVETTSANYRHAPGFLAARPSSKEAATPTPTPTPGPTPTPTPTPDCEFPTVSIEDGAVFTRDTAVTLSLCAPRATEMKISNDGGFAGIQWEPYAKQKAWTLTGVGNYVVPRFVYAVFKDAANQIYSTYIDDILLDPTAPEAQVRVGTDLPLDETLLAAARSRRGSAPLFQAQGVSYLWRVDSQPLDEPVPLLRAKADGSVDLYLSARDDVGNVTQMQVSSDGAFSGSWESYSALKQYTPSEGDGVKTVYARFQDEAGNVSQAYTGTFALDTLPPLGGIALSHPILGPDVVTSTVWLGAEDNLSGVSAMRLSTDSTFADAVWRPFASTSTWVYAEEDRSRSGLYAQFRDNAGNESEIYDAPLLEDGTPPLVYVEVEPGDNLTRNLRIYSYDELTYPARMRITNDPLFLEGVVTQPYADTVTWTFDQRQVVWVQVQDGVGNWSEPYPAYAELPETPTPTPTSTPTSTPVTPGAPTHTPTATSIHTAVPTSTPTPAATWTSMPVTPGAPTHTPTATSTHTAVPTSTPTPTSTPVGSSETNNLYLPQIQSALPAQKQEVPASGTERWWIFLPFFRH